MQNPATFIEEKESGHPPNADDNDDGDDNDDKKDPRSLNITGDTCGWPSLTKAVQERTRKSGNLHNLKGPDVRPKEKANHSNFIAWGIHQHPGSRQALKCQSYPHQNKAEGNTLRHVSSSIPSCWDKERHMSMHVPVKHRTKTISNHCVVATTQDIPALDHGWSSFAQVNDQRSSHSHGGAWSTLRSTNLPGRSYQCSRSQRETLQNLITKEPEEIAAALSSRKTGFQEYLSSMNSFDTQEIAIVFDLLDMVLVLRNASLHKLLEKVLASGFIMTTLIPYVSQLALSRVQGKWNQVKIAGTLIMAFQENLPTKSVEIATIFLATIRGVQRAKLLNQVDDFQDTLDSMLTEIEERNLDAISHLKEKHQTRHQNDLDPPKDFREIPIFPTADDFAHGIEVFLRGNRTRGAYDNVNQYLDIQFRLLREDFMTHLRQGIMMLKHVHDERFGPKHIENIYIYKSVRITGTICNNKGTLAQISFDASFLKHVNWKVTKRLLDGSLVVLSADNFGSIITGIVVSIDDNRPGDLRRGFVNVLITDCEILARQSDEVYVMVEGTAYFEAYRHTLEGLQELNETNLPFQSYLLNHGIDAQTSPDFLTKDTEFDFKPLRKENYSMCNKTKVLDEEDWPSAEDLCLDESQHRALQAAITRKFSLIQGPPGTGKTFIGLMIVRLLIYNFRIWAQKSEGRPRPLLLVCYTNHALDQFLEGILQFESVEKVVRVGGRSKSNDDKVKQCLIRNKNSRLHGQYVAELRNNESKVTQMECKLQTLSRDLVPLKDLYQVMLSQHVESFQKMCIFRGTISYREDNINTGAEDITIYHWLTHNTPVTKLHNLTAHDCMSNEEEATIENAFKLPLKKSWMLYRLWVKRLKQLWTKNLQELFEEQNRLAANLIQAKQDAAFDILSQVRIIAMTTSGAAKHRQVLSRIGPQIVIVEEAAEVFEAHVITSLSQDCQQLILIGDHKQLRPNPSVYEMARKYHLDVSLFERMLRNNLHCESLTLQHRMRPEIAELLVPHIYKQLYNHESVHHYDDIPGVSGNLFFITHTENETSQREGRSHSNAHECEYLTSLCTYLIQQGMKQQDITVLTTYRGQVLEMKEHIRKKKLTEGVRVTAVDDYQGEENEVILLSLVRSNEEGNAGFIKVANRICVALSRAKRGLFIIGNMQLFENSSPVWRNISRKLHDAGKVLSGVPLYCQIHSSTRFSASSTYDFRKAPDGGCRRPCEARLECGHACRFKCHPTDRDHKDYKCVKACHKKCEAGHSCPKMCHETCGDCKVLVEKTIPTCGHLQMVPCHLDPGDFSCLMPCSKTLDCSHECPLACGQPCLPKQYCEVIVPGRIWPCGHMLDVECYRNEYNYCCTEKVRVEHPCGHSTDAVCSHPKPARCDKIIPAQLCKRNCRNRCPCFLSNEIVCEEVLTITCPANSDHLFKVRCFEYDDSICIYECETTLECGHQCTSRCQDCQSRGVHKPCGEKCSKLLPCQHKCYKRCNETCGPCKEVCYKGCSHQCCSNDCGDVCDECDQPCARKCPHSRCTRLCKETCNRQPCNRPCPLPMKNCHHKCPGYCGETCVPYCPECRPDVFDELHKSLGWKLNREERYVLLKPCLHFLPATFMDHWMERYRTPTENCFRILQLLNCPLCDSLIRYCPRYKEMIKTSDRNLELVKAAIRSFCDYRRMFPNYFNYRCLSKPLKTSMRDADFVIMFQGCTLLNHECKQILNQLKYTKKLALVILQCTRQLASNIHLLSKLLQTNNIARLEGVAHDTNLLFLTCRAAYLWTMSSTRNKHEISGIINRLIPFKKQGSNAAKQNILLHNCTDLHKLIPAAGENYIEEIREYYIVPCDILGSKTWIICNRGHALLKSPTDPDDTECPACMVQSILGLSYIQTTRKPGNRQSAKHDAISARCPTDNGTTTKRTQTKRNSNRQSGCHIDIKSGTSVREHEREEHKTCRSIPTDRKQYEKLGKKKHNIKEQGTSAESATATGLVDFYNDGDRLSEPLNANTKTKSQLESRGENGKPGNSGCQMKIRSREFVREYKREHKITRRSIPVDRKQYEKPGNNTRNIERQRIRAVRDTETEGVSKALKPRTNKNPPHETREAYKTPGNRLSDKHYALSIKVLPPRRHIDTESITRMPQESKKAHRKEQGPIAVMAKQTGTVSTSHKDGGTSKPLEHHSNTTTQQETKETSDKGANDWWR